MDNEVVEGLQKMQDMGIKELKIYWLEDFKEGDENWFIDVHEDLLDELCDMSWAWTIEDIKSYEQDTEEMDEEPPEWYIVVVESFSEEVVRKTIQTWLKNRGLEFEVRVISSEGTEGEKHILEMVKRLDKHLEVKSDGL